MTKMLKSSIHNIMSTFEMCGFISRNPETHKYCLGNEFLRLSKVYSQNNPIAKIIKKQMTALAEKTGELVFMAIPRQTDIIYIETAAPANSLQAPAIQGIIAPMYCTAIGKAILAHLPDTVFEKVAAGDFQKFTDTTITSPAQLRQEIDSVRERGYAIDNMEHEYGIKCVGVPILKNGKLLGGLSISGPSLRFTDDKILQYASELQNIVNTL